MKDYIKPFLYIIALIGFITISGFMVEPILGLMFISFISVCFIIIYIQNTKRYKQRFIKNKCPIIYNHFFNNCRDDIYWEITSFQNYQDEYLLMPIEELNEREKYLRRKKEHEDKVKKQLAILLNESQNEEWYKKAISFLETNSPKSSSSFNAYNILAKTKYEIEYDFLLKYTSKNLLNISKLSAVVNEYEKNRTQIKTQQQKMTKESEDDITREDIITKEIEFTEHGIYAKRKVWDGVKYTMKKQRVFVYKRCYHLDMGEPPRFHICRCSTMNNYIFANSLEIEYRKSSKAKVKVKNMDRNYIENEIGHLPLCGNCYKIMKKQFSWLDSKMDNEDFIKNVINKVHWSENY